MNWLDNVVFPLLSLNEKLLIGVLFVVSLLVVYRATIRLFSSSPIRLLFVVIANLLSVIAVVLLIIPVQLNYQENETVVLLTTGFHQSELNKEKLCDKQLKIYYLKSNSDDQVENYFDKACDLKILKINHISELSVYEPSINQLDLYGDGLSATQWKQIEPANVIFYPSELTSGFIDPQWIKEATLGETITFTAKVQVTAQSRHVNRIHSVQLMDVNNELLDEVKVKDNEVFSFSFTPKTLGQHIYRIHLMKKMSSDKDADTVLLKESIAVSIIDSTLPRVLVLQSSPKYETKYFKHWLTENNGQLLTLTQISKNKVMSEEVNLSTEVSSSLSLSQKSSIQTIDELLAAAIFTHFDLLMIDTETLLSISDGKLALMDQAIKNGLGLLVFSDKALVLNINDSTLPLLSEFRQQVNRSSNNSTPFSLNPVVNNHKKQVMLHWNNKKTEHLIDAVNIDLRPYNAEHLVYDHRKQPLVISNNRGKGKIALTTINSSFQMKINGMHDDYSQFWQFITTELASNKKNMFWLPQPKETLTLKGNMVKACLLAESNVLSSSTTSQINSMNLHTKLYLGEQAENQQKHCSIYFSNNAGWQQLLFTVENEAQVTFRKSQYIYHYKTSDWLAWQQSFNHLNSENMVRKSESFNENKIINENSKPLNKLIVFFILFLSSSFLWAERKLY
jgi:hypothetical protein